MNKKLFSLEKLQKALDHKCGKCEQCPGEVPHPCPFSEEIHGNSETLCNCCSDCRYECAMDI